MRKFEITRCNYGYAITRYLGKKREVRIPHWYQFKRIRAIGEGAFSGRDVETITVMSGIHVISERAFSKCVHLKNVYLPKSLISIGARAFEDCWSLTNVNLKQTSLVTLGAHAFANCKLLKSVKFPSCTSSIGASAFYGCESLESFKNPKHNTVIEQYTFAGCTSLKTVNLKGALVAGNAFKDTPLGGAYD